MRSQILSGVSSQVDRTRRPRRYRPLVALELSPIRLRRGVRGARELDAEMWRAALPGFPDWKGLGRRAEVDHHVRGEAFLGVRRIVVDELIAADGAAISDELLERQVERRPELEVKARSHPRDRSPGSEWALAAGGSALAAGWRSNAGIRSWPWEFITPKESVGRVPVACLREPRILRHRHGGASPITSDTASSTRRRRSRTRRARWATSLCAIRRWRSKSPLSARRIVTNRENRHGRREDRRAARARPDTPDGATSGPRNGTEPTRA